MDASEEAVKTKKEKRRSDIGEETEDVEQLDKEEGDSI